MKKTILMIMLLAGSVVFAQAQTKGVKTPEQRAKQHTDVLQKQLALSADQSAKVNAILLKQATQIDSLRANHSKTDRKANMDSRKAIMANTDASLKTVLNATQQTTYAGLNANRKDKWKGKFNGRHGAKNPDQQATRITKVLESKLNLSADQSVKVKAILLKRATQMDSLRTNKGTADVKANKDARKAIFAQTNTDLNAVLNADQQKSYSDLKNSMKERMKGKRGNKAPANG